MNVRTHSSSTPPPRRMSTDARIFTWVAASAIPIVLVLLWAFASSSPSAGAQVAIALAVLAWMLVVASAARGELLRHIRTLSNLVESIRTEDYSMKGVRARETGELAELYGQVNGLMDELKASRRSEQELLSVFEKVVDQINVAIVVCDAQDRIRLINRLATTLLKTSVAEAVGTSFATTALAPLPVSERPTLVEFRFPGAAGRWQVSQHFYRHEGQAARILFIADLQQVLADEEIAAWQRLIRVIGHEVNNSLTPISSLCQTLTTLLDRPDGERHRDDIREGLAVVTERAQGLKEFISVYARVARFPEPHKVMFGAAELIAKVRAIFADRAIEVTALEDVTVFADPVQIEQALINLLKNALEANQSGAPAVELSCRVTDGYCELQVLDRGTGIANPENLFVPFYSTKSEGAGIGLALCRQIAAKHHGHVSLANRDDGPGAIAKLLLPLPPAA